MLITSALIVPTFPLVPGPGGQASHYWRSEVLGPGGERQPANHSQMTMLTLGELNADLSDMIIEYWLKLLDEHDPGSSQHALRVTRTSAALARELGLPATAIADLQRGGLLHDIGKLFVPAQILHKRGKLTDEDWKLIRAHPERASDLIAPIAHLEPAIDIPRSHHERWDGQGYPDGLAGEEIPLTARIFAVADVWDALTSERPYRAAWTPDRALDLIRAESGRHFDPIVAEAFLDVEALRIAC